MTVHLKRRPRWARILLIPSTWVSTYRTLRRGGTVSRRAAADAAWKLVALLAKKDGSRLSGLDHAVLVAVRKLRTKGTGITIRKELRDSYGEVSFARIYRSLIHLSGLRFVASRNEPGGPERGGRPRSIFWITEEGERALDCLN